MSESEKTSVWDLFNNSIELNADDYHENHSSKKAKSSNHKNDIIWLKTLLHPSAEKQFIKFKVKEIISTSNQHIICKIEPEINEFLEYTSLIGFFNVWWWKEWLDKLDFITLQDIMNSFPVLARMRRNEPLIMNKSLESLDFYLLANEPKIIPNESDPKIGLVTSRRFLVIDWREDD